jgi:hypothetical protein
MLGLGDAWEARPPSRLTTNRDSRKVPLTNRPGALSRVETAGGPQPPAAGTCVPQAIVPVVASPATTV